MTDYTSEPDPTVEDPDAEPASEPTGAAAADVESTRLLGSYLMIFLTLPSIGISPGSHEKYKTCSAQRSPASTRTVTSYRPGLWSVNTNGLRVFTSASGGLAG